MTRYRATLEGNIPFTPEEEAEWDARAAKAEAEKPIIEASAVRAERNRRLTESDWTQVADAPVDQAAWAAYRQALRDLTAQPGFPWEVTWPDAPVN